MTVNLMFIGIIVFSLILIGVGLTILEFRKMVREEKQEAARRWNRSNRFENE